MDTLWQDIRYGARMLAKRPAFTAIVIIALALGIGANSAIFSVANAVLFRPLPYEDPEKLVMIWETNHSRGYDNSGCSPPDFREWRVRNQAFEQMAAFNSNAFNLTGADDPERVPGVEVSPALFSTLGVSPALGRAFAPEEEEFGRHRVAILSDGLWRRRFGSDPSILGKTVKLNGEEYQIVGVMPASFQYPEARTALWIPMSFAPDHYLNTRGNHYLNVVARLKPGVTLEQAQADMTSIAARLEQEFKENAGLGTRVVTLRSEVVGSVEPALFVLLGAVAFVLLIACANVANLLLARSAARQREIAIRTTLGAGRRRIVRQLLTESIMLSLAGGMLGLLLALWGVDVLVGIGPEDIPRLNEIGVDTRALVFTFGLSLLTGIVFGLVPALQTSKPDLNESLKEGSRGTTSGTGSRRIRGALVVAEVALSLVLLVGAGLMIRSFLALQSVDPGFNPENVLTMAVALPVSKYPDEQPEQRAAFFNQLTERIKGLPGVKSVGTITALPLSRSSWGKLFSRQDRPPATSLDEVPLVQYRQVAGDYFSSMGIPLVKGRLINERDNSQSQKVALVNETLARRFFPDE
ncbi:MAG TPA: ABC transporter permease, partial [Blastocatellia bacterium]|nr:ABC transporter permease [Blastocatellia bacterium]